MSGNKNSGNEATEYGNDIVSTCVYGEGKLSDGTCEKCGAGKYSVTINADNCLSCKKNTECAGKAYVSVNAEYWRPNNYSD